MGMKEVGNDVTRVGRADQRAMPVAMRRMSNSVRSGGHTSKLQEAEALSACVCQGGNHIAFIHFAMGWGGGLLDDLSSTQKHQCSSETQLLNAIVHSRSINLKRSPREGQGVGGCAPCELSEGSRASVDPLMKCAALNELCDQPQLLRRLHHRACRVHTDLVAIYHQEVVTALCLCHGNPLAAPPTAHSPPLSHCRQPTESL